MHNAPDLVMTNISQLYEKEGATSLFAIVRCMYIKDTILLTSTTSQICVKKLTRFEMQKDDLRGLFVSSVVNCSPEIINVRNYSRLTR